MVRSTAEYSFSIRDWLRDYIMGGDWHPNWNKIMMSSNMIIAGGTGRRRRIWSYRICDDATKKILSSSANSNHKKQDNIIWTKKLLSAREAHITMAEQEEVETKKTKTTKPNENQKEESENESCKGRTADTCWAFRWRHNLPQHCHLLMS